MRRSIVIVVSLSIGIFLIGHIIGDLLATYPLSWAGIEATMRGTTGTKLIFSFFTLILGFLGLLAKLGLVPQ